MLKNLSIRNFRNLKQLDVKDLSAVNIFWGSNGAGKTSVLEGIHCLATSRSFRTRKFGALVAADADQLLLFGRYQARENGTCETTPLSRIGIQRQRSGDPVIKHNGERVHRLSELSQQFPVLVMNSDSFDMLLGGPAKRRQLIDWCLFHVKHQAFFPVWQRYQRVLKQRNDALRRAKMGGSRELLAPWDEQLIALGTELDTLRQGQMDGLSLAFKEVLVDLKTLFRGKDGSLLPDLRLSYSNGYSRYNDFREAINAEREADVKAGVTRYGPHRADMLFSCAGRPASEILSRGQLKTVVSGLAIAQLRLLREVKADQVVWCLLDDIPAELDADHRHALMRCILQEQPGVQLFLTSIDGSGFEEDFNDQVCRMFHVKQGNIKEETTSTGVIES